MMPVAAQHSEVAVFGGEKSGLFEQTSGRYRSTNSLKAASQPSVAYRRNSTTSSVIKKSFHLIIPEEAQIRQPRTRLSPSLRSQLPSIANALAPTRSKLG